LSEQTAPRQRFERQAGVADPGVTRTSSGWIHFFPQAVDVCAVGMHVRQAVADPVIGVNEALAVGRLGPAPQVRDVRFRFD
jgi:hypothetical protein